MTGPRRELTEDEVAERRAKRAKLAEARAARRSTDAGYALRLLAAHGEDMRYCAPWRTWLVWDGARWVRDDRGQVRDWAVEVARQVTNEVNVRDPAAVRDALLHESAPRVDGSVKIASADQRFAVLPSDLDADPFALNCADATVDLTTMTPRPHDRADLITKITRARFDPDASSPAWDKFLAEVQTDEDVRAYLARLTGLALEGRVTEHILPVHCGPGGNGKSTFFEAAAWALGDYAVSVDIEILLARHNEAHPTAIADLFGARLVLAREADANRRLAEATVKWLTGGDEIRARHPYERSFGFTPSHTFAMLTNHRPVITGRDRGIWRRLRLIPWPVEIDAEDRELKYKLRADVDAVLAYLLAGYRDWRDGSLADPRAVVEATDAWRRRSGTLGRFLGEMCDTDPGLRVGATELYRAWVDWTRDTFGKGAAPGTQTSFGRGLGKDGEGFESMTSMGRTYWLGLGLRQTGDDTPAEAGGPGDDDDEF